MAEVICHAAESVSPSMTKKSEKLQDCYTKHRQHVAVGADKRSRHSHTVLYKSTLNIRMLYVDKAIHHIKYNLAIL